MDNIMSKLPEWNSWIALLLYWLPLSLCAWGYTVRTVVKIRKDRERRAGNDTHRYYIPDITVGTLVGYLVLTVTPVANLFASIFDVAPKLFASFFRFCETVLDMPLVPNRKKVDP
jgi:hypothetical protein